MALCRFVSIYVRWNGTRTDTNIQTYNSNLYRVQNSWGRVHDSWGSRLYDLEARDSADVAYCRRLSESAIATLCVSRAESSAARRWAASRSGACTVKRTSVEMATFGAMV